MLAFQLLDEQEFSPARHVEKILGRIAEGDVSVACWEPGQISPYHAHPADELHEYENGPERTLLFRVRYGTSKGSRSIANTRRATAISSSGSS